MLRQRCEAGEGKTEVPVLEQRFSTIAGEGRTGWAPCAQFAKRVAREGRKSPCSDSASRTAHVDFRPSLATLEALSEHGEPIPSAPQQHETLRELRALTSVFPSPLSQR